MGKSENNESLPPEKTFAQSRAFLWSALDALSAHVAILDERGVIVEVNSAWRRFAGENGNLGMRQEVGANYLDACDSAAGEEAEAVARAIGEVLAGRRNEFRLDYECRGASEALSFHMCVTRLDDAGQASRGAERILLVEDEEAVRKLVREVLSMAGYSVIEARHGREALDICLRDHEPIHVLLTDVVMPGMSGPELAGRLATLRPEMKVIYMSGYADSIISDLDAAGAKAAYIQKPFMPDALVRAVREVLG